VKLDIAIIDLLVQLETQRRIGGTRSAEALKLGIEALKLIKRNRRYTPQPYNIKLPGETKE